MALDFENRWKYEYAYYITFYRRRYVLHYVFSQTNERGKLKIKTLSSSQKQCIGKPPSASEMREVLYEIYEEECNTTRQILNHITQI